LFKATTQLQSFKSAERGESREWLIEMVSKREMEERGREQGDRVIEIPSQ
jgi:hypothetical protein